MTLLDWARFMQSYPEWWKLFKTHGQVKTELHNARFRKVRAPVRDLAKFPFHVEVGPMCRGLP